ncbi:Prevent-host-death family protein [Desulfamplus magnetovallimortis]|uniref:Prevent-host-death family protein n=1 Tax=Desulfamplus magnetovallimortis TaxID=1246637 RepID=L0R4D8_9BACT|nr:type II toxin-antitoxin system prevent-host-death family antitoxin [Desulfamplus magnetovallimortis]CCO06729.1 Prevent-host-death family protein [Desulfamplus magnetovallimortis BW-1]SLM32780.1 Prevent-host-death family protein [Desulfamplus magnetovallimortis]
MQASTKDLRFHTKEILDAAMRGEEVIITFHGKPYAKIVPFDNSRKADNKQNDFCGMWKDRTDMDDVNSYISKLRKRRSF